MKKRIKKRKGQTIVEYVLIIAIVVVAAIGVLSAFSDTVRAKIAGITKVFSPDADTKYDDADSKSIFQNLDENGEGGSSSQ